MEDTNTGDGFVFADLMACNYCTKFYSNDYCTDRNSPYFNPNDRLSTEQELRGCELFSYNGMGINPNAVLGIPKDGFLWKMVLEEILTGVELPGEPPTCAETAAEFEAEIARSYEMLEKYGVMKIVDGQLVPAEDE